MENKKDKESNLPTLTKENWTEFKEAFKIEALGHGEAGDIINRNQNIVLVEPRRDARQVLQGPGPDGRPHREVPIYEPNERGDKLFERDEKRYRALMDGKKCLIRKLLSSMDKEVKDAVMSCNEYAPLYTAYDILGLFNLTEQTIVGRGAISIYTVVAKLLSLKQSNFSSFASFQRQFKETVIDLRQQGNAEELLSKIFNALFILGVDQDQFKDKLSDIYGRRDWPGYQELSQELHTYAEAKDRMQELKRSNNEDRVNANVANPNISGPTCWNCGEHGHTSRLCRKAKHTCATCGRTHLERFCEQAIAAGKQPREESKQREDTSKKPIASTSEKKKASNLKTSSKARLVKKILAGLLEVEGQANGGEADDDDDDDYEELIDGFTTTIDLGDFGSSDCSEKTSERQISNEEDNDQPEEKSASETSERQANEEEDNDQLEEKSASEDDESAEGFTTIINLRGIDETNPTAYKASVPMVEDEQPRYILDSGCRGGHVLQSSRPLSRVTRIGPDKRPPIIHGIAGDKVKATATGTLPALGGVALVAPSAGANLLSLMEIVKACNGTFRGNQHTIIVRDQKGRVILKAEDIGDGFWSCSEDDLTPEEKPKHLKLDAHALEALVPADSAILLVDNPAHPATKPLLSAEERSRAKEAHTLCGRLRHPGDQAIVTALDNNLFSTHLTSQDFRNGRTLFGACPACAEGKMTAPPEPSSTTEPARTIGERLHCDLVPLSHKSIGGNTNILFVIDEKSSYIAAAPIHSKSEGNLREAALRILETFNSNGHTVRHLLTDDEVSLKTLGKHLAVHQVTTATTPAGLHQKRAEAAIRTVKSHYRAILAALPYQLPDELECEAIMDSIAWINRLPNSTTGPHTTPLQLFTGVKGFLPQFTFGSIGIFHSIRKDKSALPSQWGIFVGYGPTANYLRCYDPLTRHVTSKRKFEPQHAWPSAWGLKPRLRPPEPSSTRSQPDPPPTKLPLNQPIQPGFNPVSSLPRANVQTTALTPEGASSSGWEGDPTTRSPTSGSANLDDTPPVAQSIAPSPADSPSTPPPSDQATVILPSDSIETTTPSTSRPRRSASALNWKDGPASLRSFNADLHECYLSGPPPANDPPPPIIADLRHATYTNNIDEDIKDKDAFIAKTNLKTALNDPERRESVLRAIHDEIKNLDRPEVMKPVRRRDIPPDAEIIGTYLFHKEKFKADGSFDKDKARIVILSNRRDHRRIGDSISPTVNPASVMLILKIAAWQRMVLGAYDVKGAFLKTKMKEDVLIFIRVGKDLVTRWLEVNPERSKFVDKDGTLYFRLVSYVYGLQEASLQFNTLLNDILVNKMNFRMSKGDDCVFTKDVPDGKMILSVHVDDILLAAPSKEARSIFELELQQHFEIVIQHDAISYLGMNVEKDAATGDVVVHQQGFLSNLVARHGFDNLKRHPKVPVQDTTRSEEEHGDDEEPADKRDYLSLTMALMYAARLTRPDILFAVAYLATKSSDPHKSDERKLHYLLKYVAGTLRMRLRFKANQAPRPRIYCDASHHLYPQGHGQAGIVITLGCGPICSRSIKIRMITRSSSESELIAAEEGSTYAKWLHVMLNDLGVPMSSPIELMQDNKSTIILAAGGGTFKRNKHLIGKETFIRERIEEGLLVLRYLPTSDMLADLFTKPLDPSTFVRLRNELNITAE